MTGEVNGVLKKRKGSAVVLLCVLMFSVTAMICATYEASERKTAISIAESSFEIAGRSVLACYDKELLNRYDLFGFELRGDKIASMLEKTAGDSLKTAVIGTCSVKNVKVENTAWSLGNQEVFLSQIRDAAKKEAVSDLIGFAREQLTKTNSNVRKEERVKDSMSGVEKEALESAAEQEASAQNQDTPGGTVHYTEDYSKVKKNLKRSETISRKEPESAEGRKLSNGRVASSLPSVSAGLRGHTAFQGAGILSDLTDDGMEAVGDDAALMTYIHNHFQNRNRTSEDDLHFFRGEMEYILFGKLSDDENYRKAYNAIFAVREAANIAYLYSDPAKRSETLAAAEALAPGPMAPAAQLLIIASWAAFEAHNDMKNLEHNNGVPMVKTSETWMTDIDMIMNCAQEQYLAIPGNSSMDYGRYLDMLLLTLDKKTKIFRIMDLIQINMKGSVREDFILADHFAGFSLKAEIAKQSRSNLAPSSAAVITMTHVYSDNG